MAEGQRGEQRDGTVGWPFQCNEQGTLQLGSDTRQQIGGP